MTLKYTRRKRDRNFREWMEERYNGDVLSIAALKRTHDVASNLRCDFRFREKKNDTIGGASPFIRESRVMRD